MRLGRKGGHEGEGEKVQWEMGAATGALERGTAGRGEALAAGHNKGSLSTHREEGDVKLPKLDPVITPNQTLPDPEPLASRNRSLHGCYRTVILMSENRSFYPK